MIAGAFDLARGEHVMIAVAIVMSVVLFVFFAAIVINALREDKRAGEKRDG